MFHALTQLQGIARSSHYPLVLSPFFTCVGKTLATTPKGNSSNSQELRISTASIRNMSFEKLHLEKMASSFTQSFLLPFVTVGLGLMKCNYFLLLSFLSIVARLQVLILLFYSNKENQCLYSLRTHCALKNNLLESS